MALAYGPETSTSVLKDPNPSPKGPCSFAADTTWHPKYLNGTPLGTSGTRTPVNRSWPRTLNWRVVHGNLERGNTSIVDFPARSIQFED